MPPMPQPCLAPHLVAFLLLMVVVLGLSAPSEAYAYCWTNQQLSMPDQQILTYDFSNLPCSSGSYSGNYSIQGYQGNFDIQYGDQLCNTDPTNDRYFESDDQHYDSGFLYQNQWTLTSNYASFFPKVNVWCRWILGCKIQLTLCMTANLAGPPEPVARPGEVVAIGH